MQTLKPEVKDRLLAAAEAEFAASGYTGATMAAIAARASISTGNLYRYFANKEALFAEIFTEEFAATFLRHVRKRVHALTVATDLEALEAPAEEDAERMLRFFLENRTRVIVLLDRAEGSIHAGFRARFVDSLVRPSLAKLQVDAGGKLSREARLVLVTLFENTVRMIVAILESSEDETVIRTAFAGFWSYQLAGLAGFTRWVVS